jgi:hypothetical protein
MCVGLYVKYPLFLAKFNEIWIFATDFRKKLKYEISFKSVEWLHVDGQRDMTKLRVLVAFRSSANAPKKRNSAGSIYVC